MSILQYGNEMQHISQWTMTMYTPSQKCKPFTCCIMSNDQLHINIAQCIASSYSMSEPANGKDSLGKISPIQGIVQAACHHQHEPD